MRFIKKLLKITATLFAVLIVLLLLCGIYIWKVSDIKPPKIAEAFTSLPEARVLDSNTYILDSNWIRKNEFGLYEMYTSGNAWQRGIHNGVLSRRQIVEQEEAFVGQIKKMIPAPGYLKFLKYIVGFMNRDLHNYVIPEFQEEIYGISLSASDSFRWIGSNYSRLLNYHAAHDIGHALQNMMLVGCTSFGAWDTKTENGAMILGRNFDFWVGDDFARNKIVSFVSPAKGHRFAFVTWGGFIGVVSGMNEKGLTVTINAAKSDIPWGAATPVSLVAREVLQYAENIEEAIAIAHKRKMFVSESFLIGSTVDHRSVVIEKTPDTLAVYDPNTDNIACTNHYQSNYLRQQALNKEQMEHSASVYRYERLQELLQQNYPLTVPKVAAILRDYKGKGGADIGLGNEKAVNQFIAHHSIIFMPDSLQMWVSTSPWQMGTFVCYDLRKVFAIDHFSKETVVADNRLNIAADSFIYGARYKQYQNFRNTRMAWLDHHAPGIDINQWIPNNKNYYDAYQLTGDYWMAEKEYKKAEDNYRKALSLEIPTVGERTAIEGKRAKAIEQQKKEKQ